jgi:hypothetical protein
MVNVINRIVVILLLLAVTACVIILAAVPDQILTTIKQTFGPMTISLLDRIVLGAVAIVVAVGSAFLIRAELARPKLRGVVLGGVEGASAQLATDSIAARLKDKLEALPSVRSASPKVISRGTSVVIEVNLLTDPGVDVSQKATEAAAVIRETVEKGMGVKIAKGGPKVDIKYHHGPSLGPTPSPRT